MKSYYLLVAELVFANFCSIILNSVGNQSLRLEKMFCSNGSSSRMKSRIYEVVLFASS